MKPKTKDALKCFAYFFLIMIFATIVFCLIRFWLTDAGIYTKATKFVLFMCYGISMVASYRFLSKGIDKIEERYREQK